MTMTDALVPIFNSPASTTCFEHALVLEALGLDYEVRAEGALLELAVAPGDAARARLELEQYRIENAPAPPAPAIPMEGGGMIGVLAYVMTLLVITYLDDRAIFGRDWFDAGKVDAGLVRTGEWWRTITALTLHGDAAHLLGNLIFGSLFGYAAGQLLGSGAAWLSILVAGALGNGLNAFIQAPSHTSIGASTAVFAALGVVSAFVWRQQRAFGRRWAHRWGALIAGGVLLTLLGVGDEHTDIVAHLMGFVSGALAGWGWGILGPRAPRRSLQSAMGIAAIALVAVAWTQALRG